MNMDVLGDIMHLVNSIRFFDIDLARDHNIYFSIAFFPELKIFGTPMTVILSLLYTVAGGDLQAKCTTFVVTKTCITVEPHVSLVQNKNVKVR